jgi:hypothetical protein
MPVLAAEAEIVIAWYPAPMRTRRRLAWIGFILCGLILAVGVPVNPVPTRKTLEWRASMAPI